MVNYYPERVNIAKLNKQYPGLGLRDLDDEQRLLDNEMRRRRGKAPPKKGEYSDRKARGKTPRLGLRQHTDRSCLLLAILSPKAREGERR